MVAGKPGRNSPFSGQARDMKNMLSLSLIALPRRNMHLKFVGLKRHLTAAEMSKTTPTLRGGIFKWR